MAAEIIAQVNETFDKLKDKFTPNKSLMTAIAGHLLASVEDEFRTQGAGSGGWAKLAASTLRQKRRRGWSQRILEAQGNLFKSIQPNATDTEARVSTNLKYAAIQHFGGEIFHHPRTRELGFRLDKKGNLLKQEGYPNLVRFAKKTHKNAIRYTISQQSYTTTIPARPFMVLTESFKDKIIQEIKNQINK